MPLSGSPGPQSDTCSGPGGAQVPDAEGEEQEEVAEQQLERMGLTPDWIIQVCVCLLGCKGWALTPDWIIQVCVCWLVCGGWGLTWSQGHAGLCLLAGL